MNVFFFLTKISYLTKDINKINKVKVTSLFFIPRNLISNQTYIQLKKLHLLPIFQIHIHANI